MSRCGNACCGYGVRGPQGEPGPPGPPGPAGDGVLLFSGEIVLPDQSWPDQNDPLALVDTDLGDLFVDGGSVFPAMESIWLLSGRLTFSVQQASSSMAAEVWLESPDDSTTLSPVFSVSGVVEPSSSINLFFLATVTGTLSGVRLMGSATADPSDPTASLGGVITAIHLASPGS